MANILEMAKNIHPTHTLSDEELTSRYIEIYPSIKREIEFFIEVYPQTSAPLFISGQIGSGKSTLLKSFLFDNPKIHYCDIADLTIVDPKNAFEISLVIVDKFFRLTYPHADFTSIDNLIERTRDYDPFNNLMDESEIITAIQSLKNEIGESQRETKAVIIDGLDRLLELSNLTILHGVLLEHAPIWKALGQKLIFVTPLFFTQSSKALVKYQEMYEMKELQKTHFTIPVPDPLNTVFWKEFIAVRAQMDDLNLSDQQINDLIGLSGGVLRGTLVVLRHLLNLMYRNGDVSVNDSHIQQLREDVQKSLDNLINEVTLNDLIVLQSIYEKQPSMIAEDAVHLFTKDIPLALFTQRGESVVCVVHPLLDMISITNNIKKLLTEREQEKISMGISAIGVAMMAGALALNLNSNK